ncbi:hypothetical protein FACS1894152_6130 [Bacilli bacterium]|nr:hypothetical protein FACS1894152_6130 [Bacilli bacterium]
MENSFTFSSCYFERYYTNEQLAIFGLDMLGGLSRFYNYMENPFGRLFISFAGYWISDGFNTAFHEIGHGIRSKAFGGYYSLMNGNKREPDGTEDANFFKFLVKQLTLAPFKSAATYPILNNPSLYTNFIMIAAGMNNSVYFSEKISDELYSKGRIGVAEVIAYIYSKMSPIRYSSIEREEARGGDPVLIEDIYKRAGISATKDNIVFANTMSLLFSGTTYSIIAATFRDGSYYKNSGAYIKPLEYTGFRIPDLFSYITTRGISYKVVSGYKIKDDLRLIFGFEHIAYGNSATEFSFGVDKVFHKYHNVSFKIVTTFGRGFNIEGTLSLPVHRRLSVNIGGASYSTKSLLGERHAVNMENGRVRSSNMFISLSYKY